MSKVQDLLYACDTFMMEQRKNLVKQLHGVDSGMEEKENNIRE
jgi:hypothetical protein